MGDEGIRSGAGPDRLFVYGTLMPGHVRWEVLAPHAAGPRPDVVAGRLWDTGRGWPAARLDAGDRGAVAEQDPPRVPGWVVPIEPSALSEVLIAVDAIEGTDRGLYQRVVVTTVGGETTWAYHTLEDAAALEARGHWARITTWEGRPER